MYSEPLVLRSTGARSSAVHQCVCVLSFLSASLLMLCSSVQLSANRHLHRDTTVAHTLLQIRILNPWWSSNKKKKMQACVFFFFLCLACVSVCRLILTHTLWKNCLWRERDCIEQRGQCQSQASASLLCMAPTVPEIRPRAHKLE